jgi:poly-gamma-glutamate capsule biosynthesis protein CapA/YwtB (metallophosphatase superfamily)
VIKRLGIVCLLLIVAVASVLYVRQTKQVSVPSFVLETPKEEKGKEQEWTLIATGDIIPARSVNTQTLKRNDFTWSWKEIAPILSKGDITLINLESPLMKNCPLTDEGFKFCGDARHSEGLVYAGVDVVSIANNHIGNYGVEGIQETTQLLENRNMKIIGTDAQPVMVKIKNTRVGFLAYNDIGYEEEGIAWADGERIKQEIEEAKKNHDVVIVSMSWGVEYTSTPSDRQRELAYLAIDAGADLIIGNHPHWIQPIEMYKDKMIVYAHGNTIFDQMWSEETKIGVIGKYTFLGKKLKEVEFIPTYIQSYGQPMLLTGEAKEKVLQKL